MRVLVLGSGSGIPAMGHMNESVLVEVEGCSYLFDAGEPCAATMHTNTLLTFYGLEPEDALPTVDIYSIKSIFISHFDADHVGGLPMLLQVMHLWQKRGRAFRFKPENELRLYLPADVIELFKELLRALHLSRLRYSLEISPVEEGEFYVDEKVRVSAIRNTHLKEGYSYSFILKAGGKRVVYSGDLGDEFEALPLLEEETDLAIIECAHFGPERLFRSLRLKEGNIRRLLVNHIHPSLYGREGEVERLGRKYLNCEIIVGRDGLELTL
ncbi:ribonuclease Z [Candidatus Bathyarchaeota archaeon]|nr:MAG: ribonuclease Z [Candidatus Bathyarchaeota archaeon]